MKKKLLIKMINKNKYYFLLAFVAGLLLDVFIFSSISDVRAVILIALWLVNIFVFKLPTVANLFLATICFLVMFIFQFTGKELITEKFATWFFIFFGIFFIHQFKKKNK